MKIDLPWVIIAGIASLFTIEAMAYQPGGFRQVRYVQPYSYPPQNYYWGRAPQYPYAYRMRPPQPVSAVRGGSHEKALEQRSGSSRQELNREAVSLGNESLEQAGDGGQQSSLPLTDNKQPNQTKLAFLEKLRPLVIEENRRLLKLRTKVSRLLERLDNGGRLNEQEQQRLAALADKYRVVADPLEHKKARVDLLKRVDIIPVSLALAQAATESGWGRSRFAREGKNLFGIWTYDKSKGLVPKQRAQGKTHLVRKFETLGESLSYYMHNLNSHPAYAELRKIRSEKRRAGIEPEGMEMAEGLERYSAQGKEYIELIQRVIRQNDLALLDSLSPQA